MPFVISEPGSFELTQENVGTRYALVGFRTQMNMQDPEDIKQANALQDQIKLDQAEKGELVFKHLWDREAIMAQRKAYQKIRDEKGYKSEDMFGKQGEISQEMNNIGVAIGWGGQPKEGAVYLFYTPRFRCAPDTDPEASPSTPRTRSGRLRFMTRTGLWPPSLLL